ncbi:unnamed protein product [Rotaria sp. Silwood1]|nr:unnamed protein product [Rotaria sp. Silwood1]
MTDDLMQYYAPEIRQNENKPKYSELSDVYSMGVLMWQACSKGTIPYGRDTKDGEIQQRKSNKGKLSQPKQCQNKLWEIILDCLHSQLESQYNFAQVKTRLINIQKEPTDIVVRIFAVTQHHTVRRWTVYSPDFEHSNTALPKPVYVKCDNCKKEFLDNRLVDHKRTCLPKHSTVNNRYELSKFVQCKNCNQQIPSDRIDAHKGSCPLKSRSVFGSICPCFSFFRSKNY